MKPPVLSYEAPEYVDEALTLLESYEGEARVLAGGQSLVPLLSMRLSRPDLIVDVNRLDGLTKSTIQHDGLQLGAMVRQRALVQDPLIQGGFPFLGEVVRLVGHATIRNRGTVGGSLCHADPAAELPALALLSEARLTVASTRGERRLLATDFFAGPYMTALEDDELLTGVLFPDLPGSAAVTEFNRRSGDFAIAGVMAAVSCDATGVVDGARLAVFGVEPAPRRLTDVEEGLIGQTWSESLADEAAAAASGAIDPATDAVASAAYRRHLVHVLARRCLQAAYDRERATHA